VLPLTVVPKPEALPLASLKAEEASQRFFILALVLALLSAVTVIVWRHHRRDYASPRRIGRRI
jgi:cell division protein FtsL